VGSNILPPLRTFVLECYLNHVRTYPYI